MKIAPVMLAEGLRRSVLESHLGLPPQLLPIRPGFRLLDCWWDKLGKVFSSVPPIEILVASSQGFRSMESLASDPRFDRKLDERPHRQRATNHQL